MPMPTFVIAGAPKAGTNALFRPLGEHPNVALPEGKEPNYFTRLGPRITPEITKPGRNLNFTWQRGADWYRSIFPELGGDIVATGEASTHYFYAEDSAQLLNEVIPDIRIVLMLREPIRRMFSHYQQDLKAGRVEEASYAELKAHNPGALDFYAHVSRYALHVERFRTHTDADRLLVLLQEDLRQHPEETFDRVQDFLGVPRVAIDLRRERNLHRSPRNQALFRLTRRLRFARAKRLLSDHGRLFGRTMLKRIDRVITAPSPNPSPPPETYLDYGGRFEEDIAYLEELLQRRLDAWRSVAEVSR